MPICLLADFSKAADRDSTARLELPEIETDAVLAVACQDFGRVAGRDADRDSGFRSVASFARLFAGE